MKPIYTLIFSFFLSLVALGQQSTQYVKASSLNLRSEANTTATILEKLPQGTAVEVEDKTGVWSKITVNGKTGYVATKFLSETRVVKRVEAKVLVCGSSSSVAFHSYECRGLSRCRSGISKVTVSQARNRGYRACKICY